MRKPIWCWWELDQSRKDRSRFTDTDPTSKKYATHAALSVRSRLWKTSIVRVSAREGPVIWIAVIVEVVASTGLFCEDLGFCVFIESLLLWLPHECSQLSFVSPDYPRAPPWPCCYLTELFLFSFLVFAFPLYTLWSSLKPSFCIWTRVWMLTAKSTPSRQFQAVHVRKLVTSLCVFPFLSFFLSEEIQQTIDRWLRSKRHVQMDLAEPDRWTPSQWAVRRDSGCLRDLKMSKIHQYKIKALYRLKLLIKKCKCLKYVNHRSYILSWLVYFVLYIIYSLFFLWDFSVKQTLESHATFSSLTSC